MSRGRRIFLKQTKRDREGVSMISKFVREQKRYTRKELCDILECPEEKLPSFLRRLREYGVLKAVKASEAQRDLSGLLEEEIGPEPAWAGEDGYLYAFTFVGVIVAADRVLKCCPKYLLHTPEPKEELGQVLRVLEKYRSQEQQVRMFGDGEDGTFQLLAVQLFLLQDYHENGVYANTEVIAESNGAGEILWDRTVSGSFPLLCGRRPYYTELQTRRRTTDTQDYCRRLHECILTRVSRELEDAGLLELFGIPGAELSDEEPEDFGDPDYVLYRLERELNVQFHTGKQLVLKTLHAYVSRGGSLQDTDCFSLFGTTGFQLVWEKVCAEIMDNRLNARLDALRLPVPLKAGYDRGMRLRDIIEKPYWSAAGKTAADTLIPDIVSITEAENGYGFLIFDAKYYNARLEPGMPPVGQPGVEAVTKQYLYQLAYRKFIEDHAFSAVRNCFLLPTEGAEVTDGGEASLAMLESLGLRNIAVRFLPAKMAYDCYLAGRKLDVSALRI